MFITKTVAAAADVPARRGRHAGAAAARRDGAGADGRRRRRAAQPAAPARVRLRAARRDHGPVDAGDGRRRLRVHADPEAARALPRSAGRRQQSGAARSEADTQPRRRVGVVAHRRAAEADRGPGLRASAPRSIRSSRSAIGQDTTFPSLELATEDFTGLVGACAPGFSCAYMNTLNWQTPTTPLPMEINPRVVFERMFGGRGRRAQRLARMQRGPQHPRFRRPTISPT